MIINLKIRAESLGRTEAELREEMALALGRIGRKLEALIAELNHLRSQLTTCIETEKPNKIQEFEDTRKKAFLYYWYLVVQRESIGLRNHELVRDFYSIPRLP
jgi:hypothetical protein